VRRYLSSFGLPNEAALDMLHVGPNGLQETGMDLLSQMNPMLKAPLEYATGKQFHTGRDLADLDSATERLTGVRPPALLEQLAYNSPASRLLTTATGLGDERKGAAAKALNLLTGFKLSDVDMPKAKMIAARKAIEEGLRGEKGVRTFESLSVDPAMIPFLGADDFELLRLKKTLEARAREAKKKKPQQR
jgi:hypothetical protein